MQDIQVSTLGQEDPLDKKWQHIPTFLLAKDRGAWQATVRGVAKSQTQLSN